MLPPLPPARRVLPVGLLACAATLGVGASSTAAGAHSPPPHLIVLGRSVEGRPIDAIEVGNPRSPRKELVVGGIHGNEPAGIVIAQRLERSSPGAVDLWIVPDLNPDGRVADTRGNARGVDLNRNFPSRWRPLSGLYNSGPRPLSEPESRAAYRLIRRLRPQLSIWFHQHLAVVDESGGNPVIERRFAALAGEPLARLARERGSVVGWENHALPGTTAFVVELPAGALPSTATTRYAHAVLQLGNSIPPPPSRSTRH